MFKKGLEMQYIVLLIIAIILLIFVIFFYGGLGDQIKELGSKLSEALG